MTENQNLIDGCFYVNQKKYGLWYSTDKEGNRLVASLTEESCISAARFYLKGRQEGWTETKTYEREIDGKL